MSRQNFLRIGSDEEPGGSTARWITGDTIRTDGGSKL
jgi:hypothetical protein